MKQYSSQKKLHIAELEQLFGKPHNHAIWLWKTVANTFAWKAIVTRPVKQNFICLVEDRHETFYNEKKCNDKDLIWHMLGEMVKK